MRNNLQLSVEDKTFIAHLDHALEKLPSYEGMVYRSVNPIDIDHFMYMHQIGKPILFKAYTSSGTKVYDESFPIQYIINSKYGKDIRFFNEAESEILFGRNTWFWVDKTDGNTIYIREI